MSPYLGPSRPISALSGDRFANADRAHTVLSRFIVSTARQPYFLVPTRPSPNLVLDVVRAGCGPTHVVVIVGRVRVLDGPAAARTDMV